MKILAYQGISPISRAIRWQTRSLYSHIGVELDDGTVVEAWHKGGVQRSRDFAAIHTRGTLVDVFGIGPDIDSDAAEKWLLEQVGKAYDFRSVFRFLTRRHAPANDRWFCSELAESACLIGGVHLLNGTPSEHSPRDIVMSPCLYHIERRRCP